MNRSASPAPGGAVAGRHMTDAPVRDAEAVGQMITRVLGRTADALNAPNEARAILHLAHSFADELAPADPCFDRLRFIRAATEDPS